MSKLFSGLLGATALLATLGAAQFAVGQGLPIRDVAAGTLATTAQAGSVNRAGKGDQQASPRDSNKFFVTHVSALNDSSVAMRVPRDIPARESSVRAPKLSKRPVACEASASVLTEVAKMMESARCVT